MKKLLTIIVAILVIGCANKKTLTAEELAAYEAEINTWHAKRMENLKTPDGWLNLAGLYWLEQGANTFGSGESNNIVFPKDKISDQAGYFLAKGNTVSIYVNKGVTITSNGKQLTEQIIFNADSNRSDVLESGSLKWNIIQRDTKIGIRLRDLDSEAVKNFTGVDRYPIDPAYRIQAKFEKADSLRTIDITNVLGQTTAQSSIGTLVFDLNGKENRLDVLSGGDEEFFVIFADATSGKETYAAGRYIYVKRPKGEEGVLIDFNKAYNPPCVFTPYATCPLPPEQNVLTIEVKAGEKNYGDDHGLPSASAATPGNP